MYHTPAYAQWRMHSKWRLSLFNNFQDTEISLSMFVAGKLEKKFFVFHETQRFITMFRRPHHWVLSWRIWVQFTPYFLRSILLQHWRPCIRLWCNISPWGFRSNIICLTSAPCMQHVLPILSFSHIPISTPFSNAFSLCSSRHARDQVSYQYKTAGKTIAFIF